MRRYHDNNSFEYQTMDEINLVASKDGTDVDSYDTQKNKRSSEHASDGMGYVKNKRCAHVACNNLAFLGMAGTRTAEYCGRHAKDTMVNLRKKRFSHEGRGKKMLFGVDGRRTTGYCVQHAPDKTVGVSSKRCRTEGCRKQPSFGVAGTKTREHCAQHASNGMVNVRSIKCRAECCDKRSSFGVVGTKTAILQQITQLAFPLVTLGSLCCNSPVFQAQVRYGLQSATLPVSLRNTS